MPIKKHALAFGTPAKQAEALIGGCASNIAALGTTQGTAYQIANYANEFTTATSGSAAGAILPACDPGDSIFVYNSNTGAGVQIYGQTGEALNQIAANSPFTVANNKSALFVKVDNTQWAVNLTA